MKFRNYYGAFFLVVLILTIAFFPSYNIFSTNLYESYINYTNFNSDPRGLQFINGLDAPYLGSGVNRTAITVWPVPAYKNSNGSWTTAIPAYFNNYNPVSYPNATMVPLIYWENNGWVGFWDGVSGTADMGLFGKTFQFAQSNWGAHHAKDHVLPGFRASFAQNVPGFGGVIVLYVQWPGYGGAGQAANVKLGLYRTFVFTAKIPAQIGPMLPTGPPSAPPTPPNTAVFTRNFADTYATLTIYLQAGTPATVYNQVRTVYNSTTLASGPAVVQVPQTFQPPPPTLSISISGPLSPGAPNTAFLCYSGATNGSANPNNSASTYSLTMYPGSNPPVSYTLTNIEGLSIL